MPTYTSKRKRISDGQPMATNEHHKHAAFTDWAKQRGVQVNGVRAAQLPGRGVGLVTTKSIAKDERILYIPEKAMFKPDAAMLQREGLQNASPQAHLAVSAMLAFGKQESPLQSWKVVWPSNESFEQSLPMCWPSSHRELLPPPVQQPLARQLADFDKDWRDVGALCAKRDFTKDDFKYYWMIVNSRSFHWKPRHTGGGIMVMCPFIDYINHGPTGSGCSVSQSPARYEVVADRAYEPGEEILATYGAHSNDKLLVHYGFCPDVEGRSSPDDEIRLDHLIIPSLDSDIRDQLQDVGYLGGYSLSPASHEICFKTQVAVRAKLLTANEWEYFVSNGEDLGEDRSLEVAEYVKKLFIAYRDELRQKIEHVRSLNEDYATANDLLETRWSQVLSAIDAFVQA